MGMKWIAAATLAGGLALTGCAEQGGPGTGQVIGGGTGAVLGGLAGATVTRSGSSATRAAGAGIGAVAGLLLGGALGQHIDQADQRRAEEAARQAHAAPIGEDIAWNNPDTGNYGTITPTRDGYNQAGQYCREYRTNVNVGGRVEEAFGTACQQADGTWKIVS